MAIRWRACENCGRLSPSILSWPSFANPAKQVCCECYATLQASSEWVRSTAGNTSGCPYKVLPPPTSAPPDTARDRYPIPKGCEYRFMWMWWMALTGRINEGLAESEVGTCHAP